MADKCNMKNRLVKRILQELKEMQSSPSDDFMSLPLEVYVTDHDTSPPENQVIMTDQMNILIRSLLLKQQHKGESNGRGGCKEGSRKSTSERAVDRRASTKRAASSSHHGSQQDGPKSRLPEDLSRLTVERLRSLLRERGLSLKGKKDELIGGLKSAID